MLSLLSFMLSCYHLCYHVNISFCYHVIMLSFYHVIMLSCYHVIMLSCYHVIMLLCYHPISYPPYKMYKMFLQCQISMSYDNKLQRLVSTYQTYNTILFFIRIVLNSTFRVNFQFLSSNNCTIKPIG